MKGIHGFGIQTLKQYRFVTVCALFAVYSISFRHFYPSYQDTLGPYFFSALVAVPVLATAFLYGARIGLIAWGGSIALLLLLWGWSGESPLEMFVGGGGWVSSGLLLASALPVGRLHDLHARVKNETGEHLQPEDTTSKSQEFIQQVIEHIPDIVYIFDVKEGRNVYSSAAVTGVLGHPPESIRQMGTNFATTVIHPEDLASMLQHPNRVETLQNGGKLDYEYRMKHADGQWRWFYGQEVMFTKDADGSLRQVLGVAQDITERKLAGESRFQQGQIQVTLEKERELSRLKNQLMVILSHEFRTPLSIILASGELLERYFDRLTPERRAECLTTIKTQIMHLREMLDDITTLVNQGDVLPPFNPVPLDLAAVCQGIVDEFRASLGAAYPIHFQAEGDLYPIHADGVLLRPILKNLLSNAVKYSHKGGRVYCAVSRQGDHAQLVIRDEGIGIPANDQHRIFETFHRASNALHVGGLGLGLRIVHDYVELHRGTVTIDSAEGNGTTVTVRLPVQDA